MNNEYLGKVYLVGAGPGDPNLLTIKAYNLLRQCTALVYDALVPQEVIDLVSKKCECFFVGKRRGHHSMSQESINLLLADLASSHSIVVRLKGGDPFLFGRGGEEATYLQSQSILVEIVPGITSGVAALAYFGIPLTHRLVGSSVTFVTGHEGIDKLRPSVNWRALAKATNTLVIYMGVHNIEYIVSELIEGGIDKNVSAAVIQQATVQGQRMLKTSLQHLASEVSKQDFISPSIVVIGTIIDFQVDECITTPANVTMPILF